MGCMVMGLASLVSTQVVASGLLTVKSENDRYSHEGGDGHYTNGLELTWSFAPDEDHWLRDVAAVLPGWEREDLKGGAYRLIHQIYTPEDIRVPGLIANDRPYAGLLMGGISLFEHKLHAGWREARSLNLDVGMVGPASGAEFVQREFHAVIAADKPRGWEHQLDNEPVVNAAYKHAWIGRSALGALDVEYGPRLGFSLGNLYTYAASGLGLRVGSDLSSSFGIPAISPAQGDWSYFQRGQGFNWQVFASLEGRYMAHNLLLDGNTFEDSHSVGRVEWVGDALVGAAWSWDRWQLTYAHAWRTDEFDSQDSHHAFGSLILSRWF
ncbi:hypothetical protein FP66_11230 [Halomonas salina]|uniref:Lipid A deacylase LpxR family protein n=2 Tax=Halomonas salina TaxID=42565 RepID=A0ABR4WR58_9GAMM|nr:hypothetical protein FP66_11230 [Halomonas salina]